MPRSGTTLLSSELNKFNNVLVLLESKQVIKLLYSKSKYTETLNEYYKMVLPRLKEKPYTVSKEITSVIESANSKSIFKNAIDFAKCFTFFDLAKDANIVIDKNPVYIFHWKVLIKEFPEAKFIITIRNPKAFVFSKKKHFKDRMDSPYFYAHLWNEYIHEILVFQQAHPERIMLVKYEGLVSDSETLKRISTFLNINDSLSENIDIGEKYSNFINASMSDRHKTKYTDLSNPINTNRINAYEEELSLKTR